MGVHLLSKRKAGVNAYGPGAVSVQSLFVSSFPAPPEYQWPQ
nr:MAG: hypothetical protein [Bacteriophage sp.]